MATIIDASSNKIKLDNGSVVTANTGGWYDGQQYWGGTLSQRGVINSLSNQQGAGQRVSDEVNAASAAAQGVSVQDFNRYLSNVSASDISASVTPAYSSDAQSTYISGLNQQVDKARQALESNFSTQRTEVQASLAAVKAKENAALSEMQKLTTPFRETLETEQRAKYGTEDVLSQQKTLLGELDQLLTEGNELIRLQKETTGLAAIRNPRIQKTMDDVAARAGVINAVVSLQNTYLSNAYTAIDRSVNAISQDRQDQLSYYSTILNLANRDIVTLTDQDRELAEEQTNLLKGDLNRATATADYIKELMINPDTAMAMAQSGVTLNDSVEVINQKMAKYQYFQEIKSISNEMSTSGYSVVTNPSSVPTNQLVTITDSTGKNYYYKKNLSGGGFVATDFLSKLSEMGYKVSGNDTESDTSNVDTLAIWNEVLNGDYSTYAGKPNFSPAGGVGTIWADSSGRKWIYGPSGWVSYNGSS